MEQKLFRSEWILVEDISLLIWCDMHAIQDNLIVLNTDERLLYAALSHSK